MLYLLAIVYTIFHIHYGVCVVIQMANHLKIDAFRIKDFGDVRLLQADNASDDEIDQIDVNDMEVIIASSLNSNRNGPEEVDEREIFKGSENLLRMSQKYTHEFHCVFRLANYPFDSQVCY